MEADRQTVTSTGSAVGVFDSSAEAESALAQLRAEGLGPDDVSVMMRDGRAAEQPEEQSGGSPIAGGAATGAVFGGLLGGLAGWMVAIGAIAIPGVGLVVGAGALAATITGIGIGAAAGGIIGSLLGMGVPEEDAREYEGHIREGRILLTVHPSAAMTTDRAVELMQANGGYDVRVYGAPTSPAAEYDFGASPASEYSAVAEAPEGDYYAGQSYTGESHTGESYDAVATDKEGEVAATTDDLGSGAEGGPGTGEAIDAADEGAAQAWPDSTPETAETAAPVDLPAEREPGASEAASPFAYERSPYEDRLYKAEGSTDAPPPTSTTERDPRREGE